MWRDLRDGRLLTVGLVVMLGVTGWVACNADDGPTYTVQMRRDSLAAHVALQSAKRARALAEAKAVRADTVYRTVVRRIADDRARFDALPDTACVPAPVVRQTLARIQVEVEAAFDTARAVARYYRAAAYAADTALALEQAAHRTTKAALAEERKRRPGLKQRLGDVLVGVGIGAVAVVAVVF